MVGVAVGVSVGVSVGVRVCVGVSVGVAVGVKVGVGGGGGVGVGVGVKVGVGGVDCGTATAPMAQSLLVPSAQDIVTEGAPAAVLPPPKISLAPAAVRRFHCCV